MIPYLDMLSDYYIVIKRFIDNLWLNDVDIANHRSSLIEKDITFQYLRQLETHGMPGITKIDPTIVLSTLIFTSSIMHAADHIIYYKIANTYGMYGSTIPWITESKDGNKKYTWKNVLQGSFNRTQWLALGTQTFNTLFVQYKKSFHYCFKPNDLLTSKKLYNNFKNVLYRRKRIKCNQIHDLFRKELYYVNQQWYWALDIDDVPASTSF